MLAMFFLVQLQFGLQTSQGLLTHIHEDTNALFSLYCNQHFVMLGINRVDMPHFYTFTLSSYIFKEL